MLLTSISDATVLFCDLDCKDKTFEGFRQHYWCLKLLSSLNPYMVVQTSAFNYQLWFRIDFEDADLDYSSDSYVVGDLNVIYKAVLWSLAKRYGGDPSGQHLNKLLRVPGFYNMKADPFPASLVYYDEDAKVRSYKQSVEDFGVKPRLPWSSSTKNNSNNLKNSKGEFDVSKMHFKPTAEGGRNEKIRDAMWPAAIAGATEADLVAIGHKVKDKFTTAVTDEDINRVITEMANRTWLKLNR